MTITIRYSIACALGALIATACSEGSTSAAAENETSKPDSSIGDSGTPRPPPLSSPLQSTANLDEAQEGCMGVRTQVAFDEAVRGVTAEAILAFAEGTHHETIRWRPSGEIACNKSGDGPLHVTIERGERAHVVNPTPATAPLGCQSWLAIEVHISIQSEDGGLNEAFDAELWAMQPDRALLYARSPELELAGDLTVSLDDTIAADRRELEVSLGITEHGVHGTLFGKWTREAVPDAGDAGGFQRVQLAYWGDADCYPFTSRAVPLDAQVEIAGHEPRTTFSGQQLIDTLTAFDPLTIDWDDGTSTEAMITFVPVDGACVAATADLASRPFTILGRVKLKSADGKLDADWPGELTPVLHDGSTEPAAQWHYQISSDADYISETLVAPAQLGFPKAQRADGLGTLSVIADMTVRAKPARVAGRIVLTASQYTCTTETCMVAIEGANVRRSQ